MDIVFIDTSVFEGNNFFESKRINEILKLSEEGFLKIILPKITYKEVVARATLNVKGALSKQKKYRDETRVLRNIPSIKDKFELIEENLILEEFLEYIDNRFRKAKIDIVDYPTVSIEEVFEKYFKEEFPFSRGEKKNEFPDAFALLSIEKWCKDHKAKCFVFSTDKNLLHYKSEYLVIVESYEKFLDEKLREIETSKKRQERIEFINRIYERDKIKIEHEVNKWLSNQLSDNKVYNRYSHLEIHSVSVKKCNTSLQDFQIISINDNSIDVEAKAEISYKVELEINDEDHAYYDDDEREWHYLDTEFKLLDQEQIIKITLTAEVPIAGERFMDFEINEINRGLDLQIKDNEYY